MIGECEPSVGEEDNPDDDGPPAAQLSGNVAEGRANGSCLRWSHQDSGRRRRIQWKGTATIDQQICNTYISSHEGFTNLLLESSIAGARRWKNNMYRKT